MAAKIMATDDPREQKALGRKVSNFNDDIWKKNCRKIVKKGNVAKVIVATTPVSRYLNVILPTEKATIIVLLSLKFLTHS